jgi:ADP-ribose pyrophosphatase YjhB (NUDIX family)
MSEKHSNFDEKRLFAMKSDFCGFRFCPRCRQALERREIDGHLRPACPDSACGYVFYQNPVPAAGAVIVEDGRVLLVKRAHPPRIGWWCLPAGFMEWHEHPEETAVREVLEETGLQIELTSFFEVYSGSDDPRTNAILLLYLAKVIAGEPQASDDAEEVAFFPLDALPEKIAFESHVQALGDYRRRFVDPDR